MNGYIACPRCGSIFYRDQPWKKICLECWLKEKDKKSSSNANPASDLRREFEEVRAKLHYYASRCRQLEIALEEQATYSGLSERIKDLIFLCHPDKHDNSTKATAVTAWLLDARKELCQ